VIANLNARKNYSAGANPHVVADGDWLVDHGLLKDFRHSIRFILICLSVDDDACRYRAVCSNAKSTLSVERAKLIDLSISPDPHQALFALSVHEGVSIKCHALRQLDSALSDERAVWTN
jgi:hypothetical protein